MRRCALRPRTAGLVALAAARLGARSLGKNDNPPAPRKSILALFDDLLERILAFAAINADHLRRRDAPTKKRHPIEFALVDECQVARHRGGQPKRSHVD